jgi:hypothetical protein
MYANHGQFVTKPTFGKSNTIPTDQNSKKSSKNTLAKTCKRVKAHNGIHFWCYKAIFVGGMSRFRSI